MSSPLKGKPATGFSMAKGGGFSAGAKGFSMKKPKLPPDPLKDVPVTGDPETDSAAEMDALLAAMTLAEDEAKHRAIKDREKAVAKKIDDMTNPWFYSRLCFQSEAQARAFNEALGIPGDSMILDGVALARRLGIELPEADVATLRANAKPDKRLNALVREFKED